MASRFWVGGTGTWDAVTTTHWAATSGGAGGQTVPGVSDDVTLDASSGGGTVTVNTNFSINSLTMGAFTGTLDFSANNNNPTMGTFSNTGTGTRTLNMGNGTWNISGSGTTIWTQSTATNLTFNANGSTINFTYSGSVGTRSTTFNAALAYNDFKVSAGSDAFVQSSGVFRNVDWTGFTGSFSTSSGTLTCSGNFTFGSGMTVGSVGNAITFSATTSKTITSNGVVWNRPIVFDGVGGSWALQDALDTGARGITLTNGTLDANNKNVTTLTFSSSNSNTRTLTMGSGIWTITGNATTIWNVSPITGLTFNKGALPIVSNYAGSTGTRTFAQASLAAAGGLSAHPDFNITAGTDIVQFNSSRVGNIDFTGFAGTLFTGTWSAYGNVKFSAGMTVSSTTNAITFLSTSGVQVFTTAGITIDRPITINAIGGTLQMGDDLIMGTTSTSIITHSAGGFDANNKNITTVAYSGSNATVRSLNMGSGIWLLTGTGTVWTTATTTNLTFNRGTSTVSITDTSASTKTFSGGGLTYYNLSFSGSVGAYTIVGSNTFNTFTALPQSTINFTAGTTTTLQTTGFNVSGTASQFNTLQSTSGGVAWNLSVASGAVGINYVSLQDSAAAGGATFYAGARSVNVSGNTGWIFATAPSTAEIAARDQNHITAIMGVSSSDFTTPVKIAVDPNTHALLISSS